MNFFCVWKCSQVIFKVGNPIYVINYPLSSVLPLLDKVFESIVLSEITLIHYLGWPIWIFPYAINIFQYNDFIYVVYNAFLLGRQTVVVYIDFFKAFDWIDHGSLIMSARSWLATTCLRSYISERVQFFNIFSLTYKRFKVLSEVSQGSHIVT